MLIKLGRKKIAGLVCFWNDIGQEPVLSARVQILLLRLRPLAFLGLDERGLLRRRGCWAAGSGASSRGGGVVIALRFLLSISRKWLDATKKKKTNSVVFLSGPSCYSP
jgi:hypothetical protein